MTCTVSVVEGAAASLHVLVTSPSRRRNTTTMTAREAEKNEVNNHVRAHTSAAVRAPTQLTDRCVRCAAAQGAGMLVQQHLPYIINHASLKHAFAFSFAALFKRLTAAAKNSHPCTCGELQPPLGIQPALTQARPAADTQTCLPLLFNHHSCSNHSPDPPLGSRLIHKAL